MMQKQITKKTYKVLDQEYTEKILATYKHLSQEKTFDFNNYIRLLSEIKEEVEEPKTCNKMIVKKRWHHTGRNKKKKKSKEIATIQKEKQRN